jgi:hypothetical protein
MNDKSAQVGQLLASLPPGKRAERYRQFASEAVRKSQEAKDSDRRAEYLTMAAGWHDIATEAERVMETPGEAGPSEDGEAKSADSN